jgi:hypothetical protein
MVKELELEIMASHQATQRPVSVELAKKGIASGEIGRQRDGVDSVISSEGEKNRNKGATCDDADINSNDNNNNDNNSIKNTDKHNSSNNRNNINSNNDNNKSSSSSNIQISDKLPEWAEDCEFTLEEIQFAAATKIQSRYRGLKGREKVGELIQKLIEEGLLEVEYSE